MQLTKAQRAALKYLAKARSELFVPKEFGGREPTYTALCVEGLAEGRLVAYQRYVRNGGFGADYYNRTEYVFEYRITLAGRLQA